MFGRSGYLSFTFSYREQKVSKQTSRVTDAYQKFHENSTKPAATLEILRTWLHRRKVVR